MLVSTGDSQECHFSMEYEITFNLFGLPMNNVFLMTALTVSLLSISTNVFSKVKCSQFEDQKSAQKYMIYYGAYYLDRDKDGEACECLPGGSKHGQSICYR